jgi:predicted RND superfamily exporter protein
VKKFAEFIIRRRLLILILLSIITLFFAYQLKGLRASTSFDDLLPQTHPYIKMHTEFRKIFGGANFLVMMLSVKEGDIFNKETLGKLKYITDELVGIPGIDRYKIISIASRKMKDLKYTEWGLKGEPLMHPYIPKNEEEMKRLKDAIFSNEFYYGSYVSLDTKKTLIFADFFEEELDYKIVYKELERLRRETENENTVLSIVGHPMHLGVVAHMVSKMNYILVGTALLIPILLFLAYRSIWGMLLVPSAGVISAIWGFGFMALAGYNLDPLIFVMPFLIALMAFRHSHQLYNRFYEEYLRHGDKVKGAKTVIERMFLPGLTSVVTDAFGIAIIAIVPIPLLRNVAVTCSFWSIITVFIGLILTPILLTYTPLSAKFMQHMEKERIKEKQRKGLANHFADWLGPWLVAKRGRYTVIVVVLIILGCSYYWAQQLIVGDAQVGSNLLWPNSRYNIDSVRINRNLPLINPMTVVISGEAKDAVQKIRVLEDLEKFSNYMANHSGAVYIQNLLNYIKTIGQKIHEDDPIWKTLPDNEAIADYCFLVASTSGDPGDMDRFVDYEDRNTNMIIFFSDKTGPTITKAIAAAKKYIEDTADLEEGTHYEVAGGVIGVEAAINEVVAKKQLQTLLIALFGVFVFCTINFRSWRAGLVLMIPLCISNFMAFAYMALNQIGLSISTLPVSAAGIGMGVDYGIYLVARFKEEKERDPSVSVNDALICTIQTYGKSIIYIAGTLVLGLLVWVVSPLKFQAQMGLMLAVILLLNCLGAVFLVPVLVILTRYKK